MDEPRPKPVERGLSPGRQPRWLKAAFRELFWLAYGGQDAFGPRWRRFMAQENSGIGRRAEERPGRTEEIRR